MRKIFAAAVVAALLIGALMAGSLASAAKPASTPAGQSGPAVEQAHEKAEPAEAAEPDDQNLAAKVTITADQATAAALAANPGAQVREVQLEDENGTVVYGVKLTAGGKTLDVKVDAQTGKVVSSQADDGHEKGDGGEAAAD